MIAGICRTTIARLISAKRAAAMKKILLFDMPKSVPEEYESKLIVKVTLHT